MNTLWEKEKMLVTSNSSFTENVFKGIFPQEHEHPGLFVNRLPHNTAF